MYLLCTTINRPLRRTLVSSVILFRKVALILKLDNADDAFIVTRDGVALPKGAIIPNEFVESTHRTASYGTYNEAGRYLEKVRIDPGTLPGYKGPNLSHFHLNNTSKHYYSNWPWYKK